MFSNQLSELLCRALKHNANNAKSFVFLIILTV